MWFSLKNEASHIHWLIHYKIEMRILRLHFRPIRREEMSVCANTIHHNNISSPSLRCTNQTGAIEGSADLFSIHQDRPHPAEGVLWLHMLHHVDCRADTGATNQKSATPQESIFPVSAFQSEKDSEAQMEQYRQKLRISPEGEQKDVAKIVWCVFHAKKVYLVFCLSLLLDLYLFFFFLHVSHPTPVFIFTVVNHHWSLISNDPTHGIYFSFSDREDWVWRTETA